MMTERAVTNRKLNLLLESLGWLLWHMAYTDLSGTRTKIAADQAHQCFVESQRP